ncbi:hypothetical protein [Micromonospora sp. NPDC048842]|uniref:hypothetical protein n=1 Tax=unclassified Micromonospora TaxID=2617518 RepID=UPI003405C854
MTDHARLLPLAQEAVDLAQNLMLTLQPGALTFKGDCDASTRRRHICAGRRTASAVEGA